MRSSNTLLLILFIITYTYIYVYWKRYICMHFNSSNAYIMNYYTLPPVKDKRVVISFTTSSTGIRNTRPMINSLLSQTVKVDMICLFIPSKKGWLIPPFISDVCTIIETGFDYGETCNTIIPPLLREGDCDTIIIAVDDSKVYDTQFVEHMIHMSDENPDNMLIDVHNGSILFKPDHFDCSVINRNDPIYNIAWVIEKAKKAKIINSTYNPSICQSMIIS